jgi:hypothetical protein
MNSEKEKFSQRLNDALDEAGVPPIGDGRSSALVEMLGITHQEAKKWLDGEAFPRTSNLVKMAGLLQVRSNWLLSGQGERYAPDVNPADRPSGKVVQQANELSKEAFDIASKWMLLPAQQRVAIAKVIQELSQSQAD